MNATTVESLRRVVADSLCVSAEKITEDSSFIEDLGADSLDVVRMVMTLEEEFGIEIPESDYHKLPTVGAALRYLKEKGVA